MYKIKSDIFHKFVSEIIENYESYGAKRKRDKFVYDRLESFDELVIDGYVPTVLPPKKYFLPQKEELVKINYKTGEAKPVVDYKDIVLVGVRPCDLTAIGLLDKIEIDGNPDPNYVERRKHITVIGFDCNKSCDEHSLCEVVGSINVKDGYDIFFSKFKDGYAVFVRTEKGKALIEKHLKKKSVLTEQDNGEYKLERAERIKNNFNHSVKYLFQDVSRIFEKSYDDPYWEEIGNKCLTCGSCIMVCPTCYCFTMEQEVDLKLEEVTVKRQWDGCLLRDFAMVAGEHNFRPKASDRLKHRWNRKFNYLLSKYQTSNCVGCGRCSRACLVDINPIDILNKIMGNFYKEVKNER